MKPIFSRIRSQYLYNRGVNFFNIGTLRVDFFNIVAIKNKELNIFNAKYVLEKVEITIDTDYFKIEAVISHEYTHN